MCEDLQRGLLQHEDVSSTCVSCLEETGSPYHAAGLTKAGPYTLDSNPIYRRARGLKGVPSLMHVSMWLCRPIIPCGRHMPTRV